MERDVERLSEAGQWKQDDTITISWGEKSTLSLAIRERALHRIQEASAKQINSSTTKHLSLQHLQSVNLAFGLTITPGQCHACLDSVVVFAQAFGKAVKWRKLAMNAPALTKDQVGLAVCYARGEQNFEQVQLRR